MKKIFLFFLIISLLYFNISFAEEAPSISAIKQRKTYIDLIDSEELGNKTVLKIITTGADVKFVDFVLYKPERLVIDIIGDNLYCKKESRDFINAAFLKEVTIGYYIEDIKNLAEEKRVDLIVFTFSEAFDYSVSRDGNKIIIEAFPKSKIKAAAAPDAGKGKGLPAGMPQGMPAGMPGGPQGAAGAKPPEEKSQEQKEIEKKKQSDVETEKKKMADEKMKKDMEILTGAKEEEQTKSEETPEKIETGKMEAAEKLQPESEPKTEEVATKEIKPEDVKVEAKPKVPEKEKSTMEVILDRIEERKRNVLSLDKEKDFLGTADKEKINLDAQISIDKNVLKQYLPDKMPKVKKYTLEECTKVALDNHLPAQIALEKVKLAKLKMWEARRNIYPQMSFNFTKTTGDASALPFEEDNYMIKADQNIYDGGSKYYLLEQANVNLEVAKKTYDKVKSELVYNVEEAYYNYIMAKMNLNTQRRLLFEIEECMKREEEKLKRGLTRMVDYRNIKSNYNQIQYQIANTIKDLMMGELSLRQVIGISVTDPFDIVDSVGFKQVNINLQDATWLAYKYRPEYVVNKLMVEYNEYERKANEAKESFKIDFSGQYGYAGSAYETSILTLQENWYAGLKVSKPLGGNTVETNLVKEHASPKLGESTRGNTYSKSVKVSVLDGLKMYTEKKQADISYQEAVLELNKIEKQIETDVRTAYYDYQKSLIQIDSAFDKILFREEEIKVNEMTMMMGEGTAVQVVDSKQRLADEKSYYFQGLINYYLAIANMNKAIGLESYYR